MLKMLLALCVGGAVIAGGCARLDPDKELAAARASFAAGRYDEAAIRVSNVVQMQPANAEARRVHGEIALRSGDYSNAAEELDRAKTLGAPLDSIAVPLADAWTSLGQLEKALPLLDSVADAHAGDARYWVVRAETLLRLGRDGDVDAALESAEKAGGGGARAEVTRAGVALARKDAHTAQVILEQALASAPDDPQLLLARANLFAQTNRLDAAAADLTRAADLYRATNLPRRELTTLLALVQVYLARNDLDAAETTAQRLASRAPQAPLTDYFRGVVAYRRGRFDEAAALIQPLVSASPGTIQFRALLGAIQLALGNFGQAEQELQAVLNAAPRDPAAIKLLAETRLRQNRPEAALATLRSVDNAAAEDPQVGMLSGLASLLSGNTEQGLLYLEQAAALDPTNELLKLQLARAYLAAGRDSDASKLLEGSFGASDTALEAGLLRLFAAMRAGTGDTAGEAAQQLLQQFPSEPRALTAAAMYRETHGEGQRARELLEQAAKLETTGATARLLLASSFVQEGRRDEAETLLARVVEEQPNNAQALSALAELQASRGAYDKAADLLGKAIESSASISPRLALAQVRLRQGNVGAAREQARAAAEAAPDNPEVQAVQGLVALADGQPKDAVTLLQKAASALPNRLGVALALARAQLATGAADAARATLQRLLALAPKSLPVRFALGEAELALGNATETQSIAAGLKADYAAQSAGYLLEAEAELAGRRYAAAADSFAEAFDRDPTWPVMARLIGAQQLAGRENEALEASARWVAANPQHLPGALAHAALLQDAGRNEDALAAYRAVLRIDSENLPALNNAAWLSNELGHRDALTLAEHAYRLAGQNPAVLDTLGWVLLHEKREADAITYLSRAAELAPKAQDIHYHHASALAAAGRSAEARSVLTALLADTREFKERANARRLLESL